MQCLFHCHSTACHFVVIVNIYYSVFSAQFPVFFGKKPIASNKEEIVKIGEQE